MQNFPAFFPLYSDDPSMKVDFNDFHVPQYSGFRASHDTCESFGLRVLEFDVGEIRHFANPQKLRQLNV